MANLKMPEVNTVMIAGNLTKDPTLRHTRNGTPVANFSIASNRRFRNSDNQWQEDVCYVGVVAWNRLAESCREKLEKGSAILVEGELQSRSWHLEDGSSRSAVEIKARRIQFLSRWKDDDEDGEDHDESDSDYDEDDDDFSFDDDEMSIEDDQDPEEEGSRQSAFRGVADSSRE